MKNFIKFGIIDQKRLKTYEYLKGELYDYYMFSRYIKDVYYLDKYSKIKNLKKLENLLHHKEDVYKNLINFLIFKNLKIKKYYEFGKTLMERIHYMKFFSNFYKTNIYKSILWSGNDKSKLFNFFCKNFYKNKKIYVYEKVNLQIMKRSFFYAKGVSLLYEKNHINLLKKVFLNSRINYFDLTITKKNQKNKLETGYNLYYSSKQNFLKIIPNNKNYRIVFFNVTTKKNCTSFEVISGNRKDVDLVIDCLKQNEYLKSKIKFLSIAKANKIFFSA